MQSNYDFKIEPKKMGKKVAVVLSENVDPDISIELLSVIYEDLDIEPICFEGVRNLDEGLLMQKDLMEPLIINACSEIICPIQPLFDSEIFVLNYQKFYED